MKKKNNQNLFKKYKNIKQRNQNKLNASYSFSFYVVTSYYVVPNEHVQT